MYLAKTQNGKRVALKRMNVNNEEDLKVCQKEIIIMVSFYVIIISLVDILFRVATHAGNSGKLREFSSYRKSQGNSRQF